MLIFIDSTVINTLKNTEKNRMLLHNLEKIADAFTQGLHLIASSTNTFSFLYKENELGDKTRRVYEFLYKKYTFYDYSFIPEKVVVYSGLKPIERSKYEVNIDDPKIFGMSVLFSESQYDCEFYYALAKHINYRRKESVFLTEKVRINLRLLQTNGGGNIIETCVRNELDNDSFILLAFDTDKDHENYHFGQTHKCYTKVFSKYKASNIIDVLPLSVREKENLIPPSCILKGGVISDNRKNDIIQKLAELENDERCHEFLKYYDYKFGLTCSFYKFHNKKYNYAFTEMIKKNIFTEPSETINKKHKLICEMKPYVDKLINLLHASEVDDTGNEFLNEIFESIPEYIKNEWFTIYNKLLTFGCSVSDAFAYRTYYI